MAVDDIKMRAALEELGKNAVLDHPVDPLPDGDQVLPGLMVLSEDERLSGESRIEHDAGELVLVVRRDASRRAQARLLKSGRYRNDGRVAERYRGADAASFRIRAKRSDHGLS